MEDEEEGWSNVSVQWGSCRSERKISYATETEGMMGERLSLCDKEVSEI